MWGMKRSILCAVALSALLLSCEQKEQAAASAPSPVKVFPLMQQTVTDYGEWFGFLRGVQNTNIQPHVTGFLMSQEYKDGMPVKEGDVLFRIDDALFRAAVEQAEANKAAAEAALAGSQAQSEKAALDLERYEKLVKTAAVSEKDVDDMRQTHKAALAQVEKDKSALEQATAALAKARIDLDYTVVRAPYSGIVGAAKASVGDLVSPTTLLTTITAVDPIRVDFSINGDNLLRNIRKYGKGDAHGVEQVRLELVLEDGSTYPLPGHVIAAESKLSSSGMLDIEGSVPNPENVLRDGMPVRVRIAMDEHEALLVPQSAVRTVLRNDFIIILDRNNAPHTIPVKTGKTYSVPVSEANGYSSVQKMVAVSDYNVPLRELFRKYGYEQMTEVPVVSDSDTAVKAANISAANSRLAEGEKPEVMAPTSFTFKPELDPGMKAALAEKKVNPHAKATLPPFPVKVFPLLQQDVEAPHEWFGSLRGEEETDIRPKVTGFLLTRPFREGSLVKKGDVLYTIDPAPFKAQRDEAQANADAARAALRKAEATLDMARRDYERYTALAKTTPGAVADKTVTDAGTAVRTAEAALLSAKAGIAQAEAALHQAEINLNYTTITAPFDGRVGISKVSVGDLVSPSDPQPLVTLSSVDPMRVDFNVSGLGALAGIERFSAHLAGNDNDPEHVPTFSLILDDDSVFPEAGKVVAADNSLSKSTGTLKVIGSVPNPGALLRSGMTVRVRAGLDAIKGAFLVPLRAPMSAQGRELLVLLQENNAPFMLPITRGAQINVATKAEDGSEVVQPMQVVDVDRSTVTAMILAKSGAPNLESLVFKGAGVGSWQELLSKQGGPAEVPDARKLVLRAAGAKDELDLIAKGQGFSSVMEMALKNSGFEDLSKVRVVVEGSIMAAQAYQANMAAGAPVNVMTPTPFRYTPPQTVTPSITAQPKAETQPDAAE